MLAGLLIIGSIGFYVLLGLLTIVMWVTLENEKHFFASASMLAAFLMFSFFGGCNILSLAAHNLSTILAYMCAYIALGLGWSIVKWWFYVRKRADKYKELRIEFLESKDLPINTVWTNELQKQFVAPQDNHRWSYDAIELSKRPIAKKNKSRIIAWMVYWPWSATWTIINDPVMKLFRMLFRRFHAVFEAISKSAYKGIDT